MTLLDRICKWFLFAVFFVALGYFWAYIVFN
ncbi:MAG: hypothetical protein DDT22_01126 [candidate division WS2 bacterium]|nr:hypothetical protein [Candidatus Lithacetigena glycinireducens]